MHPKFTPFSIFLLIALIWYTAIDQAEASRFSPENRNLSLSETNFTHTLLSNDSVPVRPVANAGTDLTVNPGARVILDGSDSYDAAGNKLTYHWMVPSAIYVNNSDSSRISFIAPSSSRTTTYKVLLVVNNGELSSDPDTIRITVLGTPGFLKNAQPSVQVYPNPFVSSLTVKLSSDWQEESNVRIFNAIGVLSLEKRMSGYEYNIDASDLPPGIYFLEIRDGKNSLNRRLLKK